VCIRGYFGMGLRDGAIRGEQEGNAVRAFPVLAEHLEGLRSAAALIRKEREVEVVLLAELAVRFRGVERDAVYATLSSVPTGGTTC
jgi:predicted hydrolase (HD superfamily)